jgi:3-isopropylmalate/(R)-2-methylmalate dehydratase small subunit
MRLCALGFNGAVEPIRTVRGRIAVLDQDHVDTDRIIPARYLSRVERAGYGELLFSDVRGDGFPLDAPEAQGANILVAGTNFGCGSSREHAVWALQQAGFQAVIARREAESPGFSDIFRSNAANCGFLLVELDAPDHLSLARLGSGQEATISLDDLTITAGEVTITFTIAEATRNALMQGLDLIGTTMRYEPAIAAFERGHSTHLRGNTP